MADNNKVTIDAAWFDELRAKANQSHNCNNCKEVHTRTRERDIAESKYKELAKRCQDLEAELKAANETNSAQADQLRDALNALEQERMNKCDEVTAKRLAAAERCIDTISINLECLTSWENKHKIIEDAIRAYREKEAK